jgi:hypothetical protein
MKQILVILLFLSAVKLQAQGHKDPPTPVELTVGNHRLGVQFLMNEHFTPTSRFNFLTVTSFSSNYNNDLNNLDLISNSQVGYDIYKGISVAVGLSVNSKTGLVPVAALAYVFANERVLFVLAPSVYISENYNLEGLTVLEYKPTITKNINLYSRVQGLYNNNTKENFHERSYIQLRAGLGVQNCQFGLAANFDYYGPAKILKENYGVFIRYNFD